MFNPPQYLDRFSSFTSGMTVKPSVLVVNDQPHIIQTATACLGNNGYKCFGAFDTKSATRILEQDHGIRIVLSSLSLGRQNNAGFIRSTTSNTTTPREVIVFSKNINNSDELLRAIQVRAFDFLYWPFQEETLVKSIDKASDHLATRQSKATQTAQSFQSEILDDMRQGLADLLMRSTSPGSKNTSGLGLPEVQKLNTSHSAPPRPVINGGTESLPPLIKAQKFLEAKGRFFQKAISTDAALSMLLELYNSRNQPRDTPVTALCYASGIAQTTALRRLTALEREGYVRRRCDPADKRRILVRLTPSGEKEMAKYLDFIGTIT